MKVQYNEARYGRSNGFPCASNVCSNTWALVRDAANQWVADQLAHGRTPGRRSRPTSPTFDVWDRYDFDSDGNFNEPDGYIDHFQIVHAGGDQADGDPIYGEDAIWSHRWYATQTSRHAGPPGNLIGGTQIGDTGFWIGDYTIQPENGGRSVFYHEYGHDLGLPDDYNILSGGDNNNEHWTLMAQSRLGASDRRAASASAAATSARGTSCSWAGSTTRPWRTTRRRLIELGPQEYNTGKPQAVIVVLPHEGGGHRARRAGRRSQPVVQRRRQRPRRQPDHVGDLARRRRPR